MVYWNRDKSLLRAGILLSLLAIWLFIGLAAFCLRGGIEGVLSPVAAGAVIWPLAALLFYLGVRLRQDRTLVH